MVSNSVFLFLNHFGFFFIKFRLFIILKHFLSHWRLRKSNRWLRNIKKNVVFGHFTKILLFIIFKHFLSHWRLQKSNRWLRNMKKNFFLAILLKFGFSSFLRIFGSLVASEIEQVASKHEKKNVVFGHFTKILLFILFGHLRVTGGFGNRTGGFETWKKRSF